MVKGEMGSKGKEKREKGDDGERGGDMSGYVGEYVGVCRVTSEEKLGVLGVCRRICRRICRRVCWRGG